MVAFAQVAAAADHADETAADDADKEAAKEEAKQGDKSGRLRRVPLEVQQKVHKMVCLEKSQNCFKCLPEAPKPS